MFDKFLYTELTKKNSISTGSELLDRAVFINIGSSTLLRSKDVAVGCTAICLDLTEELTKQGKHVCYFDFKDSIMPHRLKGVNQNFLYICQPTNKDDIISVFQGYLDRNISPVYILDGFQDLEKTDDFFIEEIIEYFLMKCNLTLIGTQNKGMANKLWKFLVDLTIEEKFYDNTGTQTEVGHTVQVCGPNGFTTVYIERKTGRMSRGYEYAILSELPKNSVFTYKNISAKGFNNFVNLWNESL